MAKSTRTYYPPTVRATSLDPLPTISTRAGLKPEDSPILLAPLTSLRRSAVSRTRAQLDTAQQLIDEAEGREGTQPPEELDPEEAEQVVDDVYAPLMGNAQSGNGQSGGDSTDEEAAPKGVAGVDDRKVRKLEVFIAYAIFFLLGMSSYFSCIMTCLLTETHRRVHFAALVN